MPTVIEKKVKAFSGEVFKVEKFVSGREVVDVCANRPITSGSFHNERENNRDSSWTGVSSFKEAESLLASGYQPTVEALKQLEKTTTVTGEGKRYKFVNSVAGFQPIIPNALLGLPNSMIDMRMKPIKSKVLNVYYNMSASASTSKEKILEAGKNLLGAILQLEMQGYKFNLYAVQNYFDRGTGCDMLVVKVKDSSTPIDLKRISFPLTHPAFFRVIGFDWYSRFPKGKYRVGYGEALSHHYSNKQMNEGFEELFGEKCVVFSCADIIGRNIESLKDSIVAASK